MQKRTLDEEGRGKYVKNVKCSMMMSYASGKRLIETCYKKKDIADWLVCSTLLGGYAKWLFIYTLFCTLLFIGCVVVCNGIFVLVCAHVFAVSFCCCSPHSYSLPRRWYYNKYTTFLLCNSVAERNRLHVTSVSTQTQMQANTKSNANICNYNSYSWVSK